MLNYSVVKNISGIVAGDLFALSHLMLIRIHEEFTGEKTEAQTGSITRPRIGAGN